MRRHSVTAAALAFALLLAGASAVVSGPAQAAGTASISGRLFNANGGAVNSGLYLWREVGGTLQYVTSQDPYVPGDPGSGQFSFTGLEPGTYKLEAFGTTTGGGWAGEWWDDAGVDPDAATPIHVSDGQAITGVQIELDRYGSVSGRVTDLANDGVHDVYIHWYYQSGSGTWVDGAGDCCETSLSDGTYTLDNVPAGPIRISYEPSGVGLASRWTGPAPDESVAGTVEVGKSEDLTDVDMTLLPTVRHTGRVVDASGDPVEDVRVSYYMPWQGGHVEVTRERGLSDENGDFTVDLPRLPGPAAAYDLRIGFKPLAGGLLPEFWQDKTTLAASDPFIVPLSPPYSSIIGVLGTGAQPGSIANTRPPRVLGTPKVGRAVSADNGGWSPGDVTFTYQWHSGGADVPGATAAAYVARPADRGKRLSVTVVAHKAGHTNGVRLSNDSAPVAIGTITTSKRPTVTGAYRVGATLRAKSSGWTPGGVRLTYRWFADGKAIKGATGKKLKLGPSLLGRKVRVRVTARTTGYAAATASSRAAKVKPAA